MTSAEAVVMGLAVALLALVRLSADLAGTRTGALLAALALMAVVAVVLHRCGSDYEASPGGGVLWGVEAEFPP